MYNLTHGFGSFSVDDLKKAHAFYSETLGLKIQEQKEPGFAIKLTGADFYVYPKEDHKAATYTVLNFEVQDIDQAVNELNSRGIFFEQYPELKTDAKGISRDPRGPLIAWFKDPAGNILSVLQKR